MLQRRVASYFDKVARTETGEILNPEDHRIVDKISIVREDLKEKIGKPIAFSA